MRTKTITIARGKAVIVIQGVAKSDEERVREIFHTTLERLEEIISVPAEKVLDQLKREDAMRGTPAGSLKAYRYREGLTQADLAKKAGLKQGHISEMERGKRAIGVKSAKALASVLNCRWEKLITE
jgi:DNA-binding XRE family transcriptional regulator